MFKGRLGIWAGVIIAALFVQWIVGAAPKWFETDELTVNINVSTDSDLRQLLSENTINKLEINVTDELADVHITTEDEEGLEEYVKYENYIYSPLVMYASDVYYNDGGFIAVPNEDNCYKVDLHNILIAMENGAEWDSLGFDKDVAKGVVKLYIPNEQCAYYNKVEELFYLTLNNGVNPTEAAREQLKSRVDELLKKCEKVSDVGQAIYEEYQEPTKEHKVFIGPEYLYVRNDSSMTSKGSDSFRPVYFLKTVRLEANVCVKQHNDEEGRDFGNELIKVMKEESDFMGDTGWRVKNSTYDLDYIGYVYYNNP